MQFEQIFNVLYNFNNIDERIRINERANVVYSYLSVQLTCFKRFAPTIKNRISSNLRNKNSLYYYCDNFLFLHNYYNIVEFAYNIAHLTIVLIFVFFLRSLFFVAIILYYKRYYLNNRRYYLYLLINSFLSLIFFRIKLRFISAKEIFVQSFALLFIFKS